jgi:hypothetical protein
VLGSDEMCVNIHISPADAVYRMMSEIKLIYNTRMKLKIRKIHVHWHRNIQGDFMGWYPQ